MSRNFIKLTGGDSDIETPKHVIDTVLNFIIDGGKWTHYAGEEVPIRALEIRDESLYSVRSFLKDIYVLD